MGRIRRAIDRLLDRIDPPPILEIVAPCPVCGRDVWQNHVGVQIDPDLTFVRCLCGHATAWHVNGHGPQLVYTGEPEESDDE